MTPRDRDVLLALAAGIDRDGVPPSFRELHHALRLSSRAQIAYTVGRLEDQGLIKRMPGHARTVRLTDAGREAVGERRLVEAARALVAGAAPAADGGYVVPPDAFHHLTQAIGDTSHG